jgi:hypothetical protein
MMGKYYGKKIFLRPMRRWDENIKIDQMEE